MVFQDLQVPQAHPALQDAKASQDVMEKMARKDHWDSRGCRGHQDFPVPPGRRVYLAFQADKGTPVFQAPEENQDRLPMWSPALESRGFPGYQAREDQKEPWGSLE